MGSVPFSTLSEVFRFQVWLPYSVHHPSWSATISTCLGKVIEPISSCDCTPCLMALRLFFQKHQEFLINGPFHINPFNTHAHLPTVCESPPKCPVYSPFQVSITQIRSSDPYRQAPTSLGSVLLLQLHRSFFRSLQIQ